MMHTHSHFLLGKQYLKLQTADLKGLEAKPVSDSLLEWEAKVEGLKDTLWEGAVLLLTLHFSEAYNSVPPTVEFNAIPFHPNVDKDTGSPCIPCLDSEWNPSISISSILLSIQTMLSNPVLEGAVNPEAADMLWSSPSTYHRVVLDCVKASQELERNRKAVQLDSQNRLVRRIPFEDYLKTWTKMATTKAGSWMRNESLEDLIKRPETFAMYYGSPDKESPMGPQRETFRAIMYGTVRQPKKTEPVSEGRQARMDQMRKIYLLYRAPDMLAPQVSVQGDTMFSRDLCRAHDRQQQDLWENEVDKLVAWTHSLSVEELED
ncbi:ubiquitin-conjugating enzyme E2 U isoform X1 [Coregonus clupeaformis]|uniref:ubiquitin-conjugating enzyme E2 U isoform X1 n=1 Tax=Coregonus clupeaformis TaxID=59861 RepID=UPI001BE03400|nr:ubiquitin-conjugating enzyme E2 U isoform X1 [Coregonus clupeaformis]